MIDLNPLKERIKSVLENLLYEPNDFMLRQLVQSEVAWVLHDAQLRREVADFKVICDETNNLSGSDEIHVNVFLKPVFSISFLDWTFAIIPTIPIDYETFRGELLVMCDSQLL